MLSPKEAELEENRRAMTKHKTKLTKYSVQNSPYQYTNASHLLPHPHVPTVLERDEKTSATNSILDREGVGDPQAPSRAVPARNRLSERPERGGWRQQPRNQSLDIGRRYTSCFEVQVGRPLSVVIWYCYIDPIFSAPARTLHAAKCPWCCGTTSNALSSAHTMGRWTR